MILKNFWAHRRQNGFVFAEIALIAVLSFYLIDNITVWTYSKRRSPTRTPQPRPKHTPTLHD